MIKCENIIFKRGEKVILENINFLAKAGEITAIIGPNGAGKSTLAKLISGIDRADSGTILLNDKVVNKFKPAELARMRAVVSQKSPSNLPFSVYEIAEMGRAPHRAINPKFDDTKIIEQSLKITELTDLAQKNYSMLSGGEQQRTHIARALTQIAFENDGIERFIILDEPTSNLDPGKSYSLLSTLKTLLSENLGVIWIAHDINLTASVADKVLALKSGKVFAFGNCNQIIKTELISPLYEMQTFDYMDNNGINYVLPR